MTPPPFARILVLPRSRAATLDPGEPYAVVGFLNPGDAPPRAWPCRSVEVVCHDVGAAAAPGALTVEQSRAVAALVRDPGVGVRLLVVYCLFGIRRSISAAFAIADHYELGRAGVEWVRKPRGLHDDPPNGHVYGLVRAALAEGEPN